MLRISDIGLAFIAAALVARALGPDGYGVYAFVLSLTSLLALPVSAGLSELLVREIAKYEHRQAWGLMRGLLRRAHQLVAASATAVWLGTAGVAAYHATWEAGDRWTVLLVAASMIPFLALSNLRAAILRGLRRPVWGHAPDLLGRPLAYLTIVTVLVLSGALDPSTTMAAQVVAVLFAFAAGWVLLARLQRPALAHARPAYETRAWRRAWLPFALLSVVGLANDQITAVLLGVLSADAEVAYFRVAFTGAMLVAMPLVIVNSVIAPHVSRAHEEGSRARLQRLAQQSARYALFGAVPIGLAFLVAGDVILAFVFGEAFRHAYAPLAILTLGQLVNVGAGPVGLLLTMSGHQSIAARVLVVALILNVAIAAVTIPVFGATGGAMAVAVSTAFWNVVLFRIVRKLLGVRCLAV